MQRRDFLRGGVGTGFAGLALGAVGGALGGSQREASGATRTSESVHYGGTGRGAAQVVWSVPTDEKSVALTFDDGPHPRLTPRVLDLLADHQVRGTFFLLGSAAERHRSLVRRLLDEGHEVGNHGWSHPRMAHLGADEARDEVLNGAASLERVVGRPVRWFRSPRGILTGPILRAATDVRQDVAMWSARPPSSTLDASPGEIAEHLLEALQPGTIYCLHDGTSGREDDVGLERRRDTELRSYSEFFGTALERGYSFLTLSDLVSRSGPE